MLVIFVWFYYERSACGKRLFKYFSVQIQGKKHARTFLVVLYGLTKKRDKTFVMGTRLPYLNKYKNVNMESLKLDYY